jgi:hypothetical protein
MHRPGLALGTAHADGCPAGRDAVFPSPKGSMMAEAKVCNSEAGQRHELEIDDALAFAAYVGRHPDEQDLLAPAA